MDLLLELLLELLLDSAAGVAAGAAASAAAVCIYYVIIGGRFAPPYMELYDKVHTVAAVAAAPAADPWIHGSISFIMNHFFIMK